MFKRFSVEENVSSTSQVKNSVQRSIQNQIAEQYPVLNDVIEQILPKKSMLISKAQENIQLIVVNNEVVFYNQRDGPFFPTLRLIHKYPTMVCTFNYCFLVTFTSFLFEIYYHTPHSKIIFPIIILDRKRRCLECKLTKVRYVLF